MVAEIAPSRGAAPNHHDQRARPRGSSVLSSSPPVEVHTVRPSAMAASMSASVCGPNSPSTLTFNSSNWNQPQDVTLSAAEDADVDARLVALVVGDHALDRLERTPCVVERDARLPDDLRVTARAQVHRGQAAGESLGEGVADLISVGLDGAPDLTVVDPRALWPPLLAAGASSGAADREGRTPADLARATMPRRPPPRTGLWNTVFPTRPVHVGVGSRGRYADARSSGTAPAT